VCARREDVNVGGGLVRLHGIKTKKQSRPWTNVRHDLEAICERGGIAKVTPNDNLVPRVGIEPTTRGFSVPALRGVGAEDCRGKPRRLKAV
jgi:hypothetical protein